MKHYNIALLILLLLIFSYSCRNNKMKTNEKVLAKEMLQGGKEPNEAGMAINKKQLVDSLKRFPKGFHLKEYRNIDPIKPPILVDIAGSLNNIKEIKLGDIASQIKYIRIDQPPDSSFKKNIGFKYHLTDDYIIAINPFGMLQYTRDGRFVNTIVKNIFSGMEVSPDRIQWLTSFSFIGNFKTTVKSTGDKLYYFYSNNIAGQEYMMEYDCLETGIDQTIKYDPENPTKILGKGKILVDLNHGKINRTSSQGNQVGMWSVSPSGRYRNSGINRIDDNTYSKKLNGDFMLGIFNTEGDTLATFTQKERLINYTKRLSRNTDEGIQYEFNNKIHFRSPFNDTISQIVPPNRLLPVYVMNLSGYKVSMQQGIDPDYNLIGKIIPKDWAETNNYIFITFTKDDYDCPNNRKKKTVKIYYGLYSKLNHQMSVVKGDPFDYSPEILENNIDGGIPVWPSSYMIGNNGEILISLKGKQLKSRVMSEQFKLSEAPEAKKNELKRLAALVSDYEEILMIIK